MTNVFRASQRVDVVRCRDCRHFGDRYNCPISYLLHSAEMDVLNGHIVNTPDFYCAFGKTREGNSDGDNYHSA